MMMGNLSLLERLAVLLLALVEWGATLLYVYCLNRFHGKFAVRVIAAMATILCGLGVVILQRQLYQPVHSGRLSVNEFDIVVITESAISLFILFYGMRKFRVKSRAATDSQDSA
jgi:hypothetical protein